MDGELLEQIRVLMAAQGITQAELARELNTSRQSLNRYLTGRRGLLTGIAIEVLERLKAPVKGALCI